MFRKFFPTHRGQEVGRQGAGPSSREHAESLKPSCPPLPGGFAEASPTLLAGQALPPPLLLPATLPPLGGVGLPAGLHRPEAPVGKAVLEQPSTLGDSRQPKCMRHHISQQISLVIHVLLV